MQSYLAYKRFWKHARDQYERDKKRAEQLERGITEHNIGDTENEKFGHRPSSIDSSFDTDVASHLQSPDSRDPEKGEQQPGQGEQNGDHSSSQDQNDIRRNNTLSTIHTSQSFGSRMGHTMTGIEVRELSEQLTKRRSRAGTRTNINSNSKDLPVREKVFVVGYESEKDTMNPHNLPLSTRVSATMLIASIGFIVGFASSVDSAAITQAAEEFGVSEVAESLATGLFLIGFGVGALFAGPISETVGRNPVYIVTLAIYMIWTMASALAPNFAAQIIFRFLAGFFSSTPLTCAGGSLSDLWDPMERVYTFPVFANAAFMGPIFGPVVGGFIGQSSLISWRWCEWITLIVSGLILTLVVFFQPETFASILLKWKATHLRKITGDDRYVAEVEIRAESFWKRLTHALYRPFLLTVREPIVILFALYLTVIYIIFEGITGLAFLGIAIGLCFASLLVPLIHKWAKRDLAAIQETHGPEARLPPEKRLWFAMFGAPAVPISLLWMGWTNYPSISYWSGLVSSVLFGYGILCIFMSSYQYIIDTYEIYAASALASLTLIRYIAAGGMTVVGIPFYQNVGVHWRLTILACISALMVPVPYIFYSYGSTIRSWSKYAPNRDN
ncbi:probable benomyl/methotrexate resistance protein [Rhynchosporium graminicola]|uniref:Probable benomyl/methotrexate resistance protein n=1 Tax=Rhynchosporium graminicola TaxID=2792576 RepID=A0A1E1KAQ8_9HELO|nr:probable benomyl/methotrexate resistance protein [Rhynchosporium commune]